MAAVLCLMLIPIIATLGFTFGAVWGDMSASSVVAGLLVLAIGAGMILGAMHLAHDWDAADEQEH